MHIPPIITYCFAAHTVKQNSKPRREFRIIYIEWLRFLLQCVLEFAFGRLVYPCSDYALMYSVLNLIMDWDLFSLVVKIRKRAEIMRRFPTDQSSGFQTAPAPLRSGGYLFKFYGILVFPSLQKIVRPARISSLFRIIPQPRCSGINVETLSAESEPDNSNKHTTFLGGAKGGTGRYTRGFSRICRRLSRQRGPRRQLWITFRIVCSAPNTSTETFPIFKNFWHPRKISLAYSLNWNSIYAIFDPSAFHFQPKFPPLFRGNLQNSEHFSRRGSTGRTYAKNKLNPIRVSGNETVFFSRVGETRFDWVFQAGSASGPRAVDWVVRHA